MVAFEFVNHTEVSLIPSRYEEEQIRKQAAEIARKSYEIASLGQVFSQRPIDSTCSSLYKVSFASRPYTRKFQLVNAAL